MIIIIIEIKKILPKKEHSKDKTYKNKLPNKELINFNDNLNKQTQSQNKENNINIDLKEKYKLELTTFVKNNDSKYPIIKGCKDGTTRLEDIANYLKS